LGKLTLLFLGTAGGYNATACAYDSIHDEYRPDCRYLLLRAAAALFGSITPYLLYWITRNFGGSVNASLLTGLLFVFDGLNLIEGRLILIDSQLIFWYVPVSTMHSIVMNTHSLGLFVISRASMHAHSCE
jgi:dolichyl-phosphate-mannose--protein O-mannosyl transferase